MGNSSERPPVGPHDVGLYVHFPYCEKKCPYCDFNSHAIPHDDVAYADAILRELEHRRGSTHFSTLYFGGGTPSLWAPEQVARVIRAAALDDSAEITLEANPGTVHEELFHAFVDAGVNRFSIGTQSFRATELVQLGRIHDEHAGVSAVRAAQSTGALVSLDLIYAQPEQSDRDVDASIDQATALDPDHISAYTLTIEPDTALGRQHAEGRFTPMDDDEQAEMIDRVTRRLADAGYERYEVSSYAKANRFAKHNTLYWVGAPYLGLGAGAHSYAPGPELRSGERRSNIKSPERYLAASERDHRPGQSETLDLRTNLGDRLMMGVRVRWGIDVEALDREAALEGRLVDNLRAPLQRLVDDGLLERSGDRHRPTSRGFFFVDLIAKRLTDALLDTESLRAET